MSQSKIPNTDLLPENGNESQSESSEIETNDLTVQVESLENKLKELTEQNDRLQRENSRLEAMNSKHLRVIDDGTSQTTDSVIPSVFRISTPSGSSVHQVTALPRFGFPKAQLATSLKNVRSPSMLGEASIPRRTPSDITDIANTTITVIYLRKGVRLNNAQFTSLTPSTHASSFIVLQRPPYRQTVQSDTSMTDFGDATDTESQQNIATANENSMKAASRTLSLPIITGFTSGSNLTTYNLDFAGISRIEAHRSRSWPSHRQMFLRDFTSLLASYLEDSDSEFDLDEDFVLDDSHTHILFNNSQSSTFRINNATNVDFVTDGQTQARPGSIPQVRRLSTGPTGSVLEQPFTEPLRSVDVQPINVLTTDERVRSGQRLIRRRGISVLPTREHAVSSWSRNIRAQLFLNVTLTESSRGRESMIAENGSSSSSSASLGNSLSDLSLLMFDLPELDAPGQVLAPEEGHGEQGQVGHLLNHLQAEVAEPPIIPPVPEDDSSSSEDSGQGDAASEGSSSSDLSMVTHTPRSGPAPSFPYPSESNLGGKYGYLRAAIRRPRAADGHRFVVSLFGTIGRRNNEQSLPSWVPVYANRLECILNQILDKKESGNRNGPALQVLQNSVRSRSVQSFRSIVTFTDSQENQLDSNEFSSLRRPRQLKSCLRVSSKGGSTGETIPKNLSWSQKVSVHTLDAQRPPSPQTEEVIKTPAARTQSCPDIILTTVFHGHESRGVMTMPIIVNPVEVVECHRNSGGRRNKNGFAARFVRRLFCSCGDDLKRSSSLDCGIHSSR